MVEVGEPKSSPLNQFDFVVDAFSEGICPAFEKVIQDKVEPIVQGHQKRLKRNDILFLHSFDPMLQGSSGFFAIRTGFKDGTKLFFQLMANFQFR